MTPLTVLAASAALALPLLSFSQSARAATEKPLFRDASATLPAKQGLGHSMNAQAADMDGDGDADIVVAMEYGRNRLLLNNGKGVFTDASDRFPDAVRDSEETALLDVDGDRDIDVVVANEDDLRPELYLNDGKGRFTDASDRLAVRVKANAVIAFDANGDGHADLFFGGDKVSVLMIGNGKGQFRDESLTRLPNVSAGTQDVEAGDFDRDGDLDLVLGNEDRNQIYTNDGKGVFKATNLRPPRPRETRDVELFDVNGDGWLDMYFANVRMGNPMADPQDHLVLGSAEGWKNATDSWLDTNEESTLSALPLDLDRDGRIDLVTSALPSSLQGPEFDGKIRTWRNTGSRLELVVGWLPAGIETAGLDILGADFDGDGKADLFVSGRAGPDRLLLSSG